MLTELRPKSNFNLLGYHFMVGDIIIINAEATKAVFYPKDEERVDINFAGTGLALNHLVENCTECKIL